MSTANGRSDPAARTNEPEAFARRDGAKGTEKLQLKIGGMSCSFCVASITKAMERMDGVHEASVNLAHEEALIEYEPEKVSQEELKETLLDLGYSVRDANKVRTFEEEEAELRGERNNLLVSAGFTVLALAGVMSTWMGMEMTGVLGVLLLWLMPTLALSTIFGPGWHILTMPGRA